MFNLGLSELTVIAVIAVLVIGPKELPVVMAQMGRLFKRLSYMRFALSQQFDGFLDRAGLGDIQDQVNFENTLKDIHQPPAQLSPADQHKAAIASALAAHSEPLEKPAKKTNKKKTTKKSAAKKPSAVKAASKKVATKKATAKKSSAKPATKKAPNDV